MQQIFTLDAQGKIGIVNSDFLIENFQRIIFLQSYCFYIGMPLLILKKATRISRFLISL